MDIYNLARQIENSFSDLKINIFDYPGSRSSGEFESKLIYNNLAHFVNKTPIDIDTIIIYNNTSGPKQIAILFHELAHATGEPHRLARPWQVALGKIQDFEHFCVMKKQFYSTEEILAETVAKKLMEHYGLSNAETIQHSDEYISNQKLFYFGKENHYEIDLCFNYIVKTLGNIQINKAS